MLKNINKNRIIYYCIGLVVLALGLTLNTKAGLGVSPILAVAYSISNIFHLNFANMTLVLYVFFIFIELIIHFLQKREKIYFVIDLLQIVFSVVFTRFMNIFVYLIPTFATDLAGTIYASIPFRLFILALAIILTGIGAILIMDMKLICNPADGLVQALASVIHKEIGLTKNIVDFICVIITCIICIVFNNGHIIGINIGTILAMLLVGRVMAIFNHFFLKYLIKSANLIEQ